MKATLLSIGSELLQGFLTDTNVTFLAQELGTLGIEVVGVFQVGDSLERLTLALERALDDSDLVVTTGGIGPTADDLTREAIADVCREKPEIDPVALETVRDFFTRRGAVMPERNEKQAWTIPSADILPNPNGTAPGWLVRHNGKFVVSMPGVPREMMPMWRNEAAPRLADSMPQQSIVTQTLKTIGIGESAAEQELRDIIERGYPTVATYAKNDGVHIRIHASSEQRNEAQGAVDRAEADIREALGHYVYGYLDDSLPHAVLSPLVEAGDTLAIWEAGTSGQVIALLMSDDLVSQAIVDGRVTSHNTANEHFKAENIVELARHCANAMASNGDTSYSLGIAANLGPPDNIGRHDARIGIAVATSRGISEVEHKVAAAPAEVRRRATLLAAEFLRLSILDARSSHPA
ncbi:MAG: competence/damage-inducible protein A [Chloroflexia bacterium]|nr:competence/damage-inducible protein A [Chloroflexia bacterium]